MNICNKNECTACYACTNACPHKCISMQEDKYGELHPVVDESKCKHCKLCIHVCPNNKKTTFNYPNHCYASWLDDKSKREICASGGIGTALSEYVINIEKGIVFGTAYDEEMTPRTIEVSSLEGVEKLKGSKYVQSIVGEETFQKIQEYLKKGSFVLYIGTPCQISGLQSFLHKDYQNLLTVDLICHGVCPTRYFKEELKYLYKQLNISKPIITNVRFRGNDTNNYALTLWNGDTRLYKGTKRKNYYLAGFMKGVSLRENCFLCKYTRPDRISDITLGDFIGLGKKLPFQGPTKNISCVMTNTSKGYEFYQTVLKATPYLKSIERSYEERLQYKPSLMVTNSRHNKQKCFRELYLQYGYRKSITEVLKLEMIKDRIYYYYKTILRVTKLNRIIK